VLLVDVVAAMIGSSADAQHQANDDARQSGEQHP
jgi:hypothetical protein